MVKVFPRPSWVVHGNIQSFKDCILSQKLIFHKQIKVPEPDQAARNIKVEKKKRRVPYRGLKGEWNLRSQVRNNNVLSDDGPLSTPAIIQIPNADVCWFIRITLAHIEKVGKYQSVGITAPYLH